MELKAKKIDEANGVAEAVISKDDIKKSEDKMAKEIAKTAKIDGFRKGKVPALIIKQRYGQQIEQDAKNEMVGKAYQDALKELNVTDVLGEPAVTKFEEKDGNVECEIKFCFRPAIDLGDYSKHVPTHKEIKVTAKAVKEAMQNAANQTAQPTKIARARKLKEGDFAVFDFEGKVDGVAFEGGAAKDYQLEIGSGQFIPGFEDGMIGLKPGESKDVEVKFPDGYQAPDLAGKDAVFSVTLNEIREKKDVEINEDVAKQMMPQDPEASVEKFEEMMKEQLVMGEKQKLYQDELKPKLLEALVKAYKFDLPETIVEKEVDHLANQKAQGMKEEELKELSESQDKIKELRDLVKPEAEERVKTTLIIDALAKAEEVTVADQEVQQVLYYEALRSGMNPQEMMEQYQQSGMIPVIKMSMIEEKVLSKLIEDKNKTEEKPKKAPAKKPAAKKAPAKKTTKKEEEK
ncbi:MAG: trigger factor [Campylobacterales bacterium]|nr:trigger factor [Campylobacterales bacterium]